MHAAPFNADKFTTKTRTDSIKSRTTKTKAEAVAAVSASSVNDIELSDWKWHANAECLHLFISETSNYKRKPKQ